MPAARPTRTDALLAVAVFCLVAAAVVVTAVVEDGRSVARGALALGFATGFGVLVLCARRWPTAALLATAAGIVGYYVVDLPPIGLAATLAAALYVAAERGRVRTALVVAAALLAASLAVRLREGDDAAVVLGSDLGAQAALVLAVIALGDAVRSRRSLRAELARQAEDAVAERRREAARQVDAERVRIARELHDTLGHAMSVITLQSAVAAEALADGATAQTGTALAAVRAAAAGAMSELRATLGTLRDPAGPEPAAGIERLAALAEGITRSGLPVEVHVTGEVGALPAVVRTTAHRIAQEALTNALRHARATRVVVTVRASAAGLELEVRDDGQGARDDAEPAGHGLRGMRERVALLGGTVHAGNADGGGFRVRAHLPPAGSGP